MKKLLSLGMAIATAFTGIQAHAASATWDTTSADGNWFSAGADWSTGANTNPGTTTGTTSTDTATFLSSNNTTIAINNSTGTLNVGGITFGAATTALSSFTIGSTGGKAIYLSGTGSSAGSGISFLADTTPTNIVETINAPLILGGTVTFTNSNATASNVLAIGGNISAAYATAGTLALTGVNTGTNTVSGNISNGNSSALGVTKSAAGTWILSGNNSYSGLTSVTGGTLVLSGSNSGAGGVTVGNGATVNINNANALGTGTFTIVGGSKFDNASGGAITAAANNAVSLGGSSTFVGSNSLNLGTGAVTQTALSTLSVTSSTLTLGGNITGTFNLTKSGAGTLALGGNNSSLTGTVSLGSNTSTAAGTLDINSATALGTGTFVITGTGNSVIDNTSTGAVVNLNNNAQTWAANFTYGGTQNLNLGTGSVTLTTSAYTITTNGGNLTVGGVIGSGSSATLTKAGSGTLTLAGANQYTGSTTLSAGTLILANSAALNGGINVSAGTTLDLQSTNAVATTVTGNATISSDVVTPSSAGTTQTLGALSIGAFTLNTTAGSNVSGGTPVVAFGATTLSNGTGATTTLNPTTAALTLTSVVGNQGTGQTDTLDLDGTSTGTVTGVIGNGSHGTLAVVKSNSSAWTLSGTNTYGGGTTVSGGTLVLTGSTAATGTFTVGGVSGGLSTATLGGTGTINGLLVTSAANSNVAHIAPGATAGTVGTLHVGNVGFTVGAGTQFDYDINTSTSSDDLISMSGGTLTIGGSGIVFNFDQVSALTAGTAYTLISGATSVSGFSAADFSATGDTGYTAAFNNTGSAITVTFTAIVGGSNNYYFTGATSNDFTVAGNYNTLASAGTVQSTALSSSSNVYLNATSPTPINTPATLNANASINSLNFVTAGTSLAGSSTVTLAATGTAGITDSAGTAGQTETVAPSVILGSNQSWTATANSTLNVTGNVSGAQSLALTGNGTYKLGGANTFQGLTVGTGTDTPTLYLTNGTSGSASGTTTLRVNAGATLAGNGTSSGTSFNISGTGTATGARANVLVGLTSATDTLTTNVLTLKGTSSSTIADANLTFNLNAKSTASTQLSVGNTAIAFGTDAGSVKFTLNLQGEPAIVGANTLYTLIAGTSSSNQYTGLTLGTSTTSGGVTETIITGNNLQLAFGSALDQSYYGNGSYLVLYQAAGVDDIDVVVVPEPGTWAMMLSGVALLIVIQRARRKNS